MSENKFDSVKNNTRLTGASTPVIFSDGFELNLSPLSDKDITELDNWVRARYLYIARSGISENATDEEKDRIERIAQQTAATLCWYLGYGASIMACLDGLCRILYQAAQNNHKGLTYDDLHERLLQQTNNEKFANDAVEDILNKSFPDANMQKGEDGKNPTVHNRRKKNTSKRKGSTAH